MVNPIIYLLVGFIASLLGSMAGLGGGFLAIPLLYYLGVKPQLIVSSSKFMVLINSIVSTYRYSRKIGFPSKLYVSIAIPMIITAYIGAYLVAILPSNTLLLLISLILLIAAIRMIISGRGETITRTDQDINTRTYYLGILSGLISGLTAGISGLGGGVVNMPIFLYILKLDPHTAVSMSMAVIVPSAFSSITRHLIDGIIDWSIAIPIGLGAVIGGFIGPRIALSIEKERLKRIVGLLIALATIRILSDALMQNYGNIQ